MLSGQASLQWGAAIADISAGWPSLYILLVSALLCPLLESMALPAWKVGEGE